MGGNQKIWLISLANSVTAANSLDFQCVLENINGFFSLVAKVVLL
jgi:hypothetical protein